jgi:hypothetical protein
MKERLRRGRSETGITTRKTDDLIDNFAFFWFFSQPPVLRAFS